MYQYANLTTEHKPENPKEHKRINRHGGDVRPSKKAQLLSRSKSSERPSFNRQGRLRVFAKGKDAPGLAISRSIGDQYAHSIGVTSEPGKYQAQ